MEIENRFRNFGFITINGRDNLEIAKTIIVLGVARSGTSMVARVLEGMGVFMGDKKNDVVYEDTEIAKIMEDKESNKTLVVNRLNDFIKERDSKYQIWGWKRPGAIKYINRYENLFRNPHYVIIFRDILSISLRNVLSIGAPLMASIEKAQHDNRLLISCISSTNKPCLMISYEKAICNKPKFIEALAAYIGKQYDEKNQDELCSLIEPDRPIYLQKAQNVNIGNTSSKKIGSLKNTGNRGVLDKVTPWQISGWALEADVGEPAEVILYTDEKEIARAKADLFRPDLLKKNIHPTGRCGFVFKDFSSQEVKEHSIIRVKISNTGKDLINSPYVYTKEKK